MYLPIPCVSLSLLCALLLTGCCGQDNSTAATDPVGGLTQVAAGESLASTDASLTGRCHCGKVRYEVRGPVVKTSTCDCAGCRRATGTLAAPFVTVKGRQLQVVSGEPKSYRADGGDKCDAHGSWTFCGDCGGPLWWAAKPGKQVDLFAGSLDDPSVFRDRQ